MDMNQGLKGTVQDKDSQDLVVLGTANIIILREVE